MIRSHLGAVASAFALFCAFPCEAKCQVPRGPRPRPRQAETDTATPRPQEVPAQDQPVARRGRAKAGPRIEAALPPAAKWQQSPEEQAQVDEVLQAWSARSAKIKTLTCRFTMWEYGNAFKVPGADPDQADREAKGEIRYSRPDKGRYTIDAELGLDGKFVEGIAEDWLCDGQSVFEYSHRKKKVTEYRLPPEMQGKAISDGPLPFVFGVDVEKMNARHFIRLVTPADVKDEIWLEAWPRTRQQAANYQQIAVILSTKSMLPIAIQLHHTNGTTRTVYQFESPKANNPLQQLEDFLKNFVAPKTPRGWTKVVEEAPPADPGQAQPPATDRPAGTVARPKTGSKKR